MIQAHVGSVVIFAKCDEEKGREMFTYTVYVLGESKLGLPRLKQD